MFLSLSFRFRISLNLVKPVRCVCVCIYIYEMCDLKQFHWNVIYSYLSSSSTKKKIDFHCLLYILETHIFLINIRFPRVSNTTTKKQPILKFSSIEYGKPAKCLNPLGKNMCVCYIAKNAYWFVERIRHHTTLLLHFAFTNNNV